MTSREIFRLVAKTIGLLIFCYGVIVGVSGAVLLYAVGRVTTASLSEIASGRWFGILEGDGYLLAVCLMIQVVLPVGLGLLLMGTDIVPDFCFPKRYDKRLEPMGMEHRKFEISEGPAKWKPPKF